MCRVLNLSEPHRVASRLDDDGKGRTLITTPGGPQEMTIISESGLYAVILRSDKPEAKPFRKWVTAEVLPTISKKGGYVAGVSSSEELLATMVTPPKTGEMAALCSGPHLSYNGREPD